MQKYKQRILGWIKKPVFTGINFNVVFSHGNKVCLNHAEARPHFLLRLALGRACVLYFCFTEDEGKNQMTWKWYDINYKPPLLINPYIILHYLISLHKYFLGTKLTAFQTFFLVVQGLELRASDMLGKHFPTESDSWPRMVWRKNVCTLCSSGVTLQPVRISTDNQYAPSFVCWGHFYLHILLEKSPMCKSYRWNDMP